MSWYIFKEEDIRQVEKILIKWGTFCLERRKILENFNDNIEVQACPWSWKTTLLVAKIFLLAQKIDFKKESVCILTHTNVAVDEIKEKIKKSREKWDIDKTFLDNIEKILKYPNYIWTLQSFIDKYLAIPWYLKEYGKRPNTIDDDYSNAYLKRSFFNLLENKTRKYISQKTFNPPTYDYNKGLEKFLWTQYNIIEKNLIFNTTISWRINLTNPNNDKYKEILSIFEDKIKNSGVITFQEANLFALEYLNKNNITIRKLLQNRYKFVFLDEIQDTQWIHIEILNILFSYGKSIIQWFWDKNQSILENNPDNIEFNLFSKEEKISSSRRLSKEIANTVWKCSINPIELEWIEERNIPVYYFKYKNWEENKLIEFFSQKIDEFSLNNTWNIFKAIWWTHDWIQKFKPDYQWKIIKRKEKFIDYFSIKSKDTFSKLWFKPYKDEIIEWIVRWINISKITYWWKWFSKALFITYLKENQMDFYYDLLSKIYYCICDIVNCTFSHWCNSYNNLIELLKDFEIDSKKILLTEDFFKNWATLNISSQSWITNSVSIEFNTIHWIKWETHTWTLLLDMKALSSESNFRILEYIDDDSCKEWIWANKEKSIKLFYVWITRATHLLVIWFNEDLNSHDFSSINWDNVYPK